MACDPKIIYQGKEYTYAEFMAMLNDGLIDLNEVRKFVDGEVDGIRLNKEYATKFKGRDFDIAKEVERVKELQLESSGKLVEKTLATRLEKSTVTDAMKDFFAESDRLREVDTFEIANANAARIIEEYGIVEAVKRVMNGEFEGAVRPAIIGKRWAELDDALKIETDPNERGKLLTEYAQILNYVEKRRSSTGAENAGWYNVYLQNPNLGLNAEMKIKNWEQVASGGKERAPKEVIEKFKELEAREKELLTKIKELEQKRTEYELNNIIDAVKGKSKPKPKETEEQRKQRISDKLFAAAERVRQAETSGLTLSTPIPPHIISDSLKLLATAVKGVETTADAMLRVYELIEKGIGKKLNDSEKKKVKDYFENEIKMAEAEEVDTAQPLTSETLKELISKGYNTPDLLLKKAKEFYPTKTDREVRDLITKYGKEITTTREDIDKQLSAIKSVFVKDSQLEDVKSGKLPFKRTILENEFFSDERRRKTNEIKDILKTLDVPEANEAQWKTRTEAVKTRLKNAIADMENAIEKGEMIVKNKPIKLTNNEIEELRQEYEIVKQSYERQFGEPLLTEGEKKIQSLERQLDKIRFGEQGQEKVQPEYTDAEKKEIERLQDEIAKEKQFKGAVKGKEAKSIQEKLLDIKLKSKQKQLQNAKDKLEGIPKTEREKYAVTSIEIEKIQEEIDKINQQIKDKKPKQTEEEKNIERLEKRLDEIRFGGIKRAIEKRPLSDKEKEILDEIAKEKQLQGDVKAKRTQDEIKIEAISDAIARIEKNIKDNDLEIKRKEKLPESDALRAKREVYEAVKKELQEARKEAGIIEREKLKQRLEYLKKREKTLLDRKARGDYSKAEKKKSPYNDEILTLLGRVDALKQEESKLQFLAEEQNKKVHEKIGGLLVDIWNLPRVQMATGELSFIGVQGRRLSIAELTKNPKTVLEALKQMVQSMSSKEKFDKLQAAIKTEDPQLYHTMKASKLQLLETSAKVSAMDETSFRIGGKAVWNLISLIVGKPIDFFAKTNIYEKLNDKPLYEVFERGAVAYGNYLRVKGFKDFYEKEKILGNNIEKDPETYKAYADYLNTATGRASLGKLEASAELLSKVLFSPRNAATELKLATSPMGVAYLAAMQLKSNKPIKENRALRQAAEMQLRYTLASFSAAAVATLVALQFMGSTEDNEDGTGVDTNPNSTNFGRLVFKNGKVVDLFNGQLRYLIFGSRVGSQKIKMPDNYKMGGTTSEPKPYFKRGEERELGETEYTPNTTELVLRLATNKINPTLGYAVRAMFPKQPTKDEKLLGIRRDKFGKEISLENAVSELMTPIFWRSVWESAQNDPSMLDLAAQLAAFPALINYNVNNKEKQAWENYKRKIEIAEEAAKKRKEMQEKLDKMKK